MPIQSPFPLQTINQEEFAKIDFDVMRHCFDSQNELGRLCDEIIYQNDLAARIRSAGLGAVRTEVPVVVTHGDFTKQYFLDLVVGDAAIYELKTATSLIGDHEAQLLNYLCLRDVHHGKLVNFRPVKVESRFVNTNLTPTLRRRLELDTTAWRETDEASHVLRATTISLLEDWGGFLDLALYTEALIHFLGGEENLRRSLPLARNGVTLGYQTFHLLSPDTAFRLTGFYEAPDAYERQFTALLRLTPLRRLQWVNLARHKVQFATITR